MPNPPGAPRAVPPTLHSLYCAQLAAVHADPEAPATTDDGAERGWLVTTGVAGLVEPYVTALPHVEGEPARYAGLSGAAADALHDRLGDDRLAVRQNNAPTLGTLLRAAARHPDDVEVHGYVIGPARTDERLSAEGADVYVLPALDVRPEHGDGCQCELLWYLAAERLGLDDALAAPDEITPRVNPWRPNEPCWRLWWD